MADTSETLFVARESDVEALRTLLDAARKGAGRTVVLSAPLGGGKRAVVGDLMFHAVCLAEELALESPPTGPAATDRA